MARILIAASPKPQEICKRIVRGHEFECTNRLKDALQLLETRKFDLIISTPLFDESRMIDLLREVRSRPHLAGIPFVCFRCVHAKLESLTVDLLRDLQKSTRLLGATAFINIDDYSRDNYEQEIRRDLDRLLPPAS